MAKHRRRVSRINQSYSAGSSDHPRTHRCFHIRQQRQLRRKVQLALHCFDYEALDRLPTRHTQSYYWW